MRILERSEIRFIKNKNHLPVVYCASTEIRTPVLALKGLRPGPLDDGGINEQDFTRASPNGQALDINSFYIPGGDFSQALILQC